MGAGGGKQTSTTTTQLPPELSSWANKYLNALGNQVMPGGKLGPSPLPFQEVAPLTPQQTQGMQLTSQETYGPGGPPPGSGALDSSLTPQTLMAGIASSPYWRGQMWSNPSNQQAFSLPALSQLAQIYGISG